MNWPLLLSLFLSMTICFCFSKPSNEDALRKNPWLDFSASMTSRIQPSTFRCRIGGELMGNDRSGTGSWLRGMFSSSGIVGFSGSGCFSVILLTFDRSSRLIDGNRNLKLLCLSVKCKLYDEFFFIISNLKNEIQYINKCSWLCMSDCYLTSSEQCFSYIMMRTSSIRWWWLLCTRPTHLVTFL